MDPDTPHMKVVVFVTTYNGLATGPFISCCGDFLLENAPSFGTTIQEIELYPHCDSGEPTLRTLESMRDRFQDRLTTLPIFRVYRRYRRAFVSYRSCWLYSGKFFGADAHFPDPELFSTLCHEMVSAMDLLGRRIKPADDFNMLEFRAHLQRRLAALPTDAVRLRRLQEAYPQRRADIVPES
jgi:hypothetical protein